MSDAPDMSTLVTRGELRAELAQLEMRLEKKLAQVATKAGLEPWGGALLVRIESGEKRMVELMGDMEQRLLVEPCATTDSAHREVESTFGGKRAAA